VKDLQGIRDKVMKIRNIIASVAGVAMLAIIPNVQASLTILTPGTGASPIGTDSIDSGAVLIDTITSVFLPSVPPSGTPPGGTLTTKVYSNDPNNTLGGLSFEYILNVTDGGVDRLSLNGWQYNTSVGVANESGTDALLANFLSDGSTVGFTWSTDLLTGDSSTVIIDSALQGFSVATASLQDGGQATALTAAAVPVPESTTILAGVLLLLPLGASTLRILRRNRMA